MSCARPFRSHWWPRLAAPPPARSLGRAAVRKITKCASRPLLVSPPLPIISHLVVMSFCAHLVISLTSVFVGGAFLRRATTCPAPSLRMSSQVISRVTGGPPTVAADRRRPTHNGPEPMHVQTPLLNMWDDTWEKWRMNALLWYRLVGVVSLRIMSQPPAWCGQHNRAARWKGKLPPCGMGVTAVTYGCPGSQGMRQGYRQGW